LDWPAQEIDISQPTLAFAMNQELICKSLQVMDERNQGWD
jgi:hypothetical protein